MSRRGTLIAEIERGALDDSVPLAATLRKCIALGGQTRSAELRDWASRELNGYGPEDELPDWRIVGAPIQVDGFGGNLHFSYQTISVWQLPDFARDVIKEEVPLRSGVAELDAMIRSAEKGTVRLGLPGGSDLVAYMNHVDDNPFRAYERIYYAVSTTAIHGVLDRIRTTLTGLVAELRHGMPDDVTLPTGELADQAVHIAVSGKRNRVVVSAPQASGQATNTVMPALEPEPETPRQRSWARILGWVGLAVAVIGAIYTALQYYE